MILRAFLLFTSLWGGCLIAQEQEQRMRRILEPDRSRAYDLQTKTFETKSGDFNKVAPTRGYAEQRGARTRPFLFWRRKDGDLKTKAFEASAFGADKNFTTTALPSLKLLDTRTSNKEAKTEAALEAGEEAQPTRTYPFVRATTPRGTRQAILDEQTGERKPLTVDQVRELLNKND